MSDKLRVLLPSHCAAELKEAIRCHKATLLDLMQLRSLVVNSAALNTIIFFAPSEATKKVLVAAGAAEHNIYSTPELEGLVPDRLHFGFLRFIFLSAL